jgi:hypothetical protein
LAGSLTAGFGINASQLTSNVIQVDSTGLINWLNTAHKLKVGLGSPALFAINDSTVGFNPDSTYNVKNLVIRSGNLYDTINKQEFLVGAISGGSGTSDYTVATAVNTSNYATTTATFITLPDLTGQANRTVTLPSSPVTGRTYIYDNTNDNASGFTWTFAGGTVKDNNGNTITTLTIRFRTYWIIKVQFTELSIKIYEIHLFSICFIYKCLC